MDVLLITQPKLKQNEANSISKLFDAGLERLHIRKPEHTALEISCLLDAIPEHCHPNIVIHRHPELDTEYNLAGYHHSDREEIRNCKGTNSRSLHSLKDLSTIDHGLDYVFFGQFTDLFPRKAMNPKYHSLK